MIGLCIFTKLPMHNSNYSVSRKRMNVAILIKDVSEEMVENLRDEVGEWNVTLAQNPHLGYDHGLNSTVVIDKNELVVVRRADIVALLEYTYHGEAKHYQEWVDENHSRHKNTGYFGGGHIFTNIERLWKQVMGEARKPDAVSLKNLTQHFDMLHCIKGGCASESNKRVSSIKSRRS